MRGTETSTINLVVHIAGWPRTIDMRHTARLDRAISRQRTYAGRAGNVGGEEIGWSMKCRRNVEAAGSEVGPD
jgi:hypothetical protein